MMRILCLIGLHRWLRAHRRVSSWGDGCTVYRVRSICARCGRDRYHYERENG